MGELIRTHDWSATPLGPVEGWPQSLRTTVDLVLASGFPMVARWGPELIQIYNDGYRVIMGEKHPAGLGQPTRDCWPEVWPSVEAHHARVLSGEMLVSEDTLYQIERHGYPENAWFALTHGPLRNEHGRIAGVLVTALETTERHQADAALAEAHRQREEILASISDIFYAVDREWRLTYVNHRAEAMWHRTRDELLGTVLWDMFPRYWETVGYAMHVRAMETREVVQWETESPNLHIWVNATAYPTPDGLAIYFHDISDRKHAEEALRSAGKQAHGQKEAFQSAINGEPLADSLGILARMAIEEMAGAARTAFYIVNADGTHLHPIRGAGDMPDSYTAQVDGFVIGTDSLACGLATATGCPVLTRDVFDEPRWVPWVHLATAYDFRACWSFPIETHDGLPIGTFALYFRSARDATARELTLADAITQAAAIIIARHIEARERARAEVALRVSEQNVLGVAHIVPDLLWYSEPDGSTYWYNDRWLEYTGQSIEQASGWGWVEAIHPYDRDAAIGRYAQAVEQCTSVQQEYRIRRRDGAYRWFLVRAEPALGENGRVRRMYGAATDIHEQRAEREELAARVAEATAELRNVSRRLLQVQEDERRHLARELHDEIGQTLTGLQLRLQASAREMEGEQGGHAHVSAALAESAALVRGLTEQVRTLSMDLRPAVLDTLGLLPALLWHVERYQSLTGILVDLRHVGVERRLPPAVEIAAYRVVQEALTNIARHAGAGEASVQLLASDGVLTVVVRDRGRGFDPDATPSDGGVGGMRERVALLGGSFEIESSLGEGTLVRAELQVDDATEVAQETHSGEDTAEVSSDGRTRAYE
jgi:PAS domain S-box-containing protein